MFHMRSLTEPALWLYAFTGGETAAKLNAMHHGRDGMRGTISDTALVVQ